MCWMSLLRSWGELLCNVFYKHYAPLELGNQRVCQRYPKLPALQGLPSFQASVRSRWRFLRLKQRFTVINYWRRKKTLRNCSPKLELASSVALKSALLSA